MSIWSYRNHQQPKTDTRASGRMKIILSRKGIDSGALSGKMASPILPCGCLCSIPIPYRCGISYSDAHFGTRSFQQIIRELKPRWSNRLAHLDPDLRRDAVTSRPSGWRPAFYFQQTLGGADINSAQSLASYQDYRFRAPNILLLQGSLEHSIWGPLGLKFMADEGRVALTRGDLGFSHMKHSFAAGLTLRAGAFPMVQMMFAWGGPEGHHNIFNMNTSLLGGSARPSLY